MSEIEHLENKIKVQEYLIENMWNAMRNRQQLLVSAIKEIQDNEFKLKLLKLEKGE